jgi:hypothetical protein
MDIHIGMGDTFELPPFAEQSPAELARRAALFERVMRHRDASGPIGISMTGVIRRFRDGGEDDRWQSSYLEAKKRQHMTTESSATDITTERVSIPPIQRLTSEELERRRRLMAEATHLRELAGVIDISTSDLIRMSREDADATGER